MRPPRGLSCAGLALAVLLAAPSARSDSLRVTVTPGEGGQAGATAAQVRVWVGDREVAASSVEVPGQVDLEVAGGSTARVAVTASGAWSPEQVVHVDGSTAARFVLRPLGAVAGTLRVPRGEAMPEAITVRAASAPGAAEELPDSEWNCPVADGSFRCQLPAGLLDLRLRARGFVSHYLWARPVAAGETAALGLLRLEPGASVVGWVTAPQAPLRLEQARVEVAPLVGGQPPTGSDRQRAASRVLRAAVGERGFFEVAGLAPGSYAVTVRHPDAAPARIAPVRVMERSETTIHRVELLPPAVLELHLDPPRDPFRQPWRLQVLERGDVPGHLDTVAEGVASPEGAWRSEGLPAGTYAVDVRDSRGSRWAVESVELAPQGPPVFLDLPFDRLEGTLRLGGEPLAAALFFGGRFGERRIRIRSDEEGKFYVFLPRQEAPWPVDVVSEQAGVSRRVEDVEVRRLPGEPWARVEIDLPATEIAGATVDAAGEPVTGAVVEARREGHADASVRSTEPEGEFTFAGLAPGRWLLQAHGSREGRRLSSESVPVTAAEEGTDSVRLVLREGTVLSGLVVSPAGQGVPGAFVMARTDSSLLRLDNVMPSASTDVDGLFTLHLPHGTERLVLSVLAPGFAVETVALDRVDAEDLVVPLQQAGGTVVISYQGGAELPPVLRRHRTELFRPEQVASSWQLRSWAEAHGVAQDDPERFVIPMLPPGDYTACYGPGAAALSTGRLPAGELADGAPAGVERAAGELPPHCARGTLPPFGELHLVVRVPEEAAAAP